MEEIFYNSTRILSSLALAVAVFYSGKKFNILPPVYRWLCFYLVIILVLELISQLLIRKHDSNISIFYAHALIEILFFGFFYLPFLTRKTNKLLKSLILGTVAIISFYIIFEGFIYYTQGVSYFYGKVFSSLCIMFFAGSLLAKNIRIKFSRAAINFLPVNVALLLYNSTSLDVFLILKHFMNMSASSTYIILGTNNVFSTLFYALTTVCILRYSENKSFIFKPLLK